SAAPEAAAVVRDMQARITIHAAATERAEAEFIVETIEAMIGGHSFRQQLPFSTYISDGYDIKPWSIPQSHPQFELEKRALSPKGAALTGAGFGKVFRGVA